MVLYLFSITHPTIHSVQLDTQDAFALLHSYRQSLSIFRSSQTNERTMDTNHFTLRIYVVQFQKRQLF